MASRSWFGQGYASVSAPTKNRRLSFAPSVTATLAPPVSSSSWTESARENSEQAAPCSFSHLDLVVGRLYGPRTPTSLPTGDLMSDVTRIPSAIKDGDEHAAERLLPLIYDELRRLAAQKMAQETPGHTLQATALVHEAYVRLVDVDKAQHWDGRGHFFAAAAEAMRRILLENARRKGRLKHGGEHRRVDLDKVLLSLASRSPPLPKTCSPWMRY